MKLSRSFQYSCILALVCTQVLASNYPRQATTTSATSASTPAKPSTPSTPSTPAPVEPTTSKSTTGATSETTSSASQTSDTTSQTSSTSSITTPKASETSQTPPSDTKQSDRPPEVSTVFSSSEETVTKINGPSSTSKQEPTNKPDNDNGGDDKGLSAGPIIGMSVAGGVAVIGIIAFFVWKFTRKRATDFDGDEAIKWPDLNSHSDGAASHPLPVNNTGRAGFETASNYSTTDIHAQDPYAVPPLPQFNPNQPYRDDPNAPSGYYDYHGTDEYGREAIPMSNIGPQGQDQVPYSVAGRQSPSPNAAYDPTTYAGRQSPGPYAVYDPTGRTGSPAPVGGYQGYDYADGDAGRRSPGPQAAYNQMGYGGRTSPGPNVAYAAQGGAAYGPR